MLVNFAVSAAPLVGIAAAHKTAGASAVVLAQQIPPPPVSAQQNARAAASLPPDSPPMQLGVTRSRKADISSPLLPLPTR